MKVANERPQIRRAQTKVFVRHLRAQPEFERLREALESVLDLDALARGSDLGWVDLEEHCTMLRIVESAVGKDRYLELWRDSFKRTLEKRFLSSVLELMRPMMGASLVRFYRRYPYFYEHFTRGCGEPRVESTSESSARIVIDGFPPEHGTRVWALASLGAAQASGLALGHAIDSVSLADLDETHGRITLLLQDKPLERQK